MHEDRRNRLFSFILCTIESKDKLGFGTRSQIVKLHNCLVTRGTTMVLLDTIIRARASCSLWQCIAVVTLKHYARRFKQYDSRQRNFSKQIWISRSDDLTSASKTFTELATCSSAEAHKLFLTYHTSVLLRPFWHSFKMGFLMCLNFNQTLQCPYNWSPINVD